VDLGRSSPAPWTPSAARPQESGRHPDTTAPRAHGHHRDPPAPASSRPKARHVMTTTISALPRRWSAGTRWRHVEMIITRRSLHAGTQRRSPRCWHGSASPTPTRPVDLLTLDPPRLPHRPCRTSQVPGP
jgi:hypothetical protein